MYDSSAQVVKKQIGTASAEPIRCRSMGKKLDRPDRQVLEDQVRRLLERARKQSGTSVEEIVHGLGELQPRGAGTRRSWYDWLEKPETVSALAVLAALHVLGPSAAADVIFGDGGRSEVGAENAALEELRALFAHVQEELIEQRRETLELRQHVDELASRRGQQVAQRASIPHSAPEVGDLDRLITGLQAQVQGLGRKLDCPWARSPAEPAEASGGSVNPTEQLSRRVRVLQGRMIEIRSMIGEPWIDDTSLAEPSEAANPEEVMGWMDDSVRALLRQVAEVNAHPAVASITSIEPPAQARRRGGG
jgi:hypothetical protein